MAFTLTGGRLSSSSSLFFSVLSHAVVALTLVTSRNLGVKLVPSRKTGAGTLGVAAPRLPAGMGESNGVATADA